MISSNQQSHMQNVDFEQQQKRDTIVISGKYNPDYYLLHTLHYGAPVILQFSYKLFSADNNQCNQF